MPVKCRSGLLAALHRTACRGEAGLRIRPEPFTFPTCLPASCPVPFPRHPAKVTLPNVTGDASARPAAALHPLIIIKHPSFLPGEMRQKAGSPPPNPRHFPPRRRKALHRGAESTFLHERACRRAGWSLRGQPAAARRGCL